MTQILASKTTKSTKPATFAASLGGRGQALVEFAVVLPLLLVVLMSILEVGFIVTDQIALSNAARDAARVGSLTGTNQSAAVAAAQSDLSQGLIQCPLQTPTANYAGTNPTTVTVTVQCTYSPVTPLGSLVRLLGQTLTLPGTLISSTAMRVEQ